MSQVIVNVTLPIVVAKIEAVLQAPSPQHPGAMADNADLRQRLTAYVLRRLPVIYVTLDQATIRRMGTPSQCYSYDQHRHIDHLIQQGLQALLNYEPIYAQAPQTVSAAQGDHHDGAVACANHRLAQEAATVSNWFG